MLAYLLECSHMDNGPGGVCTLLKTMAVEINTEQLSYMLQV